MQVRPKAYKINLVFTLQLQILFQFVDMMSCYNGLIQ